MFSTKNKRAKKVLPEVSTASLPDIIFMLLFFFMVVTVMRTEDQLIPIELPATTENEKIKQISKAVKIQIGAESDIISVNGQLVDIKKLQPFLEMAAAGVERADWLSIPVSLKVDKGSPMRTVYEVKLALRKTGLRKVQYIVKTKNQTNQM